MTDGSNLWEKNDKSHINMHWFARRIMRCHFGGLGASSEGEVHVITLHLSKETKDEAICYQEQIMRYTMDPCQRIWEKGPTEKNHMFSSRGSVEI